MGSKVHIEKMLDRQDNQLRKSIIMLRAKKKNQQLLKKKLKEAIRKSAEDECWKIKKCTVACGIIPHPKLIN